MVEIIVVLLAVKLQLEIDVEILSDNLSYRNSTRFRRRSPVENWSMYIAPSSI